jgi:hypothetical protein
MIRGRHFTNGLLKSNTSNAHAQILMSKAKRWLNQCTTKVVPAILASNTCNLKETLPKWSFMFYSHLTLNLNARHSLENNKSEVSCLICISYYKSSRYKIFFVKSCSTEMYIPSYERHLERTNYKYPWKKNNLGLKYMIQTSACGAVNDATARTYYQYAILIRIGPSVVTLCGHHTRKPTSGTSQYWKWCWADVTLCFLYTRIETDYVPETIKT